MAVENEGSA